MDDITPASPASSSASDSDAYNTESARVYFGPCKTPERKFIAASKSLFPPPQPAAVRRSPRLSSPRIRSTTPMDPQVSDEDKRDIEQVAQLVNGSDDDEGDPLEPGVETPQGGDLLPDEPSSVLADKILHALGNPSPPPSPPTTLRDFDPYHTTAVDGATDYQTDLMSLKIIDGLETDDDNPLLLKLGNQQPVPLLPSTPPLHNNVQAVEETLVDVDSFSTPRKQEYARDEASREVMNSMPQSTLSVDDLLSQSPIFAASQPQRDVAADPSENPSTEEGAAPKSPMLIDTFNSPKELARQIEIPAVVLNSTAVADSNLSDILPVGAEPIIQQTAELLVTPLRRSARPRRSVTPTPTPIAHPVFVPPPSIARTQVKKKLATPSRDSENNSTFQAEESTQRSPSPGPSTTIRVRHRSPGKAPFSFHRELGSLSPTSSNLLSTLAFVAPSEPDAATTPDAFINQAEPLSSTQPMFSFSVFDPQAEAPSTPAHSTGPIRFASPSKGPTSPNKYQLHTPAPDDPTNTPARRIPIAEGIAQGHVSLEKAARLGFQPNGMPLSSIPTPARRVLLTESTAPALTKSSNLRPASPMKKTLGQREASVEPPLRLGASVKGKAKATEAFQGRPSTIAKLPFPLVPSKPSPVEASTSSVRPTFQVNLTKAKASPVKSSLKQPTSRIPRIGTKPYARAEPKAGPKATTISATLHNADLKLPSKISVAESARQNAREAAKGLAASSTRVKPTATTSSTILKRKREPERSSPAKPRVIMLRQVPPIAAQPSEPLPVAHPALTSASIPAVMAKGKKLTQAPMRIRRVMDPEPTVVVVRKQSPPPQQQRQPEAESTVNTASQSTNDKPPSTRASPPPLPPNINADLTPGSPMDQDQPVERQKTPEQPAEEVTAAPGPSHNAPTSDDTIVPTSSLRRTTRSRRSTATQDVFQEGSSRTTSNRRKAPVFRSDDVFSGMSITALKDLTVSNTVKNQKYIAAKLETEVIRKEGTRPESPAVKIRTILQRQQDERDRERAARAKRRARRSGEDIASSDLEGTADAGSSSAPDDQMSEDEDDNDNALGRHRRGAGEDDDYETPERYRHLKRTRLFGDNGEEKEVERRRRVKWDRGLFTTVYLDEVKLGTRQTLKENRALKGILAPNAKALRLDTLGNLPHADTPLSDIVQENITVKKIVYDSDVSAAVAEVVAAAKNTRARSKKK